ncbi:ligase-associated DNA damage response DEXH box helicase [Ferruginibacter yonginensis]|uniref:Ligase-associated DNA damage response DEXH box helicase n=1 Tax=Ferruginibacter yonginensis TaxID=1310416 RepID=A0ABV8QVJ8_9BACT
MEIKIDDINSKGFDVIKKWFHDKEIQPFDFQTKTWQQIQRNQSGLVNAPTGCGKTFAVFLGAIIQFIDAHPTNYTSKKNNGLQLLWVTPLRALATDIEKAMNAVVNELQIPWQIAVRNGDTTTSERAKQKKSLPEVLIITPESLHLFLAQKNTSSIFEHLKIIAVDEWHELLGSKRGILVELAVAHIIHLQRNNNITVWGISATIGNLEEAKQVLLQPTQQEGCIIKANIRKQFDIVSIIPDEIEKYPWAGHLGIKLADKILPVLNEHLTTLLFINTRGMSEMWYQTLLNIAPELAGIIALHHGSIEKELRNWVEDALHKGILKAVVSTSSLDLGVDFRPVEAVVQVGSPKGVARFLQRAGRSGHQPNATSIIYFLPTHSLELVEAAALKEAIDDNIIESKLPLTLCFDVLIQFLCTIAIGDGFDAEKMYEIVKSTFCYHELSVEEWQQILQFITVGGIALQQYDDFKKVNIIDGKYVITSRKIAMRHRMHIGTIVSDAMLKVKLLHGGYLGVIEEYFISKLQPGDVFTLAGSNLELVMIKDMTVQVRRSNAKKSIVPSWNGGRLPLSSSLGFMLRKKLDDATAQNAKAQQSIELTALKPLFDLQQQLSAIPHQNQLLIEHIETKDGFHLFVYPFEGRLVHEAMAALLAYRLSKITPITFSFAMNDYGFELLSDQPIPIDDSNVYELFSDVNLYADIQKSVNASEMARRKFRDIAVIGGLIFQGMPGEFVKQKHLQSSASLIFNVLSEYEPNSLLLRQAYNEVMSQQMDEPRLRNMLQRIQQGDIVITYPTALTPFCFPLKVDSIRETMTSEKLEDRVKRMQAQLNKL